MSSIEHVIAQRKIERAVMQLEVTFAECAGLVLFDPEEKTASYRWDPRSNAEAIHVGPKVAGLDLPAMEMVLRHEILHRSMYNGFGEDHRHKELANLTLDVCINRLLFEAYPEPMRKMSGAMYPVESKTTPIALADVTADPQKLPSELGELWQGIWTKPSGGGAFAQLNPASLYFRLARLLEIGIMTPFTSFCAIAGDLPKQPTAGSARLVRAVAGGVNKRLPRGSDLGQQLSSYSVVPIPIGTAEVEAFLERMRIKKLADATAKKVLAPLVREIRVQPFAGFPSRLGLVYQMAGISELFGLYWNREVGNVGSRFACGVYVDVSGSMVPYFPLVSGFVNALREVPLRVRSFDTEVHAIELDALAKGKISGGGGTDFDAPLRDLVNDKELRAGVLFTDGEGRVSPRVAAAVRASRKPLYIVFLHAGRGTPAPTALDRLAKDTVVVPVGDRG